MEINWRGCFDFVGFSFAFTVSCMLECPAKKSITFSKLYNHLFIVDCRLKGTIIPYFFRKSVILQTFSLQAVFFPLLTLFPWISIFEKHLEISTLLFLHHPYFSTFLLLDFTPHTMWRSICQMLSVISLSPQRKNMGSEVLCFDWDSGFSNLHTLVCISVSMFKVIKMYFVLQGKNSPFFIQDFLCQGLRKLCSAQAAEPVSHWFALSNWGTVFHTLGH